MISLVIFVLCMIPLPVIFVQKRRKPVSGGFLAFVATANLIIGYLVGFLIICLLYAAFGDAIFEGVNLGPGALFTIFITYYLMKRNLRKKGLMLGYPLTGVQTPQTNLDYNSGLNAKQETLVPKHEDEYDTESSVDLLAQLQTELEQQQGPRQGAPESMGTTPRAAISNRTATLLKLTTAILSLVCLCLAVFAWSTWQEKNNLEAQLEAQKQEYIRLEDQYTLTRNSRNILAGRLNDMYEDENELNFWRSNAVIVTTSGERYHTYGCQYIAGRAYWIYNVEAAISIGYEPCSFCNPPV